MKNKKYAVSAIITFDVETRDLKTARQLAERKAFGVKELAFAYEITNVYEKESD